MSDKADLWKHYEIHVDLYKHYLSLLIQVNGFYYAAKGAILTYYFANAKTIQLVRYSLVFPTAVSAFLALFFFVAGHKAKTGAAHVVAIVRELGFDTYPDMNILTTLLRSFAVLHFLTFCGLSFLWGYAVGVP